MSILEFLKRKPIEIIEFIQAFAPNVLQILAAIFEFRVHIITLRGKLPKDGGDITMLYVGRSLNLPHFQKNFFVESEILETKKVNLLTFRKSIEPAEAKAEADIVFLDVGWPYNKSLIKSGEYQELPDWISMIVPMHEDWDDVTKGFRKTMRKNIGRLIRRNEYRCEPTNDPDVIKNFYDDLYVPSVSARHDGEVFLTARKLIENRARHGTVLQVMGKEGLVSAGVYLEEDETLYLIVSGMPAKYVENPPEASISALYYFAFQYAFERNLKAVSLLGTRTFPTDGVFQFKRKWGAYAEDSFSIDSILFRPAKNSLKAAKFCERIPMIARNEGKLQLRACSTQEAFGEAEVTRLLNDYHCEGLEEVTVFHVSDQHKTVTKARSVDHPNVIIVRCDEATFSECYSQSPKPAPDTAEKSEIGPSAKLADAA